ncbi:MAG: hypothetical protein WD489_06070 [Rhodovibrionaceae bacterium]
MTATQQPRFGLSAAVDVAVLLAVLICLAACDGFPADPEATTERVTHSGTLRSGIVAAPGSEESLARGFVEKLAAAAGAEAKVKRGSAELLLKDLEQGGLDVVIGAFAKESPWRKRVALSPPLKAQEPPGDLPVLRAAVRSGENRWLLFVARHLAQGRE